MHKLLSLMGLLALAATTNSVQAANLPSPSIRACADTINQQVMSRYGRNARLNGVQAQDILGVKPFVNVSGNASVVGAARPMRINFYCTYNQSTRALTQAYINNPPPATVPPPRPTQPVRPNMTQACVNTIAQKIQPQYGNQAQLHYQPPLQITNGPQGMSHYEGKGQVFNTRNPQDRGTRITFSCNAQNNSIVKADYFNLVQPRRPVN